MNYQFEEIQKLKFVVYDIDDKKHLEDTSKHDLIGQLECTLADIVTAGQEYKRTLRAKGMLNNGILAHVTFALSTLGCFFALRPYYPGSDRIQCRPVQ